MPTSPSTLSDLSYVKQALERDRNSPFRASIALLWAAIVGPGFLLNDVAPANAALYWSIAAPAGFLVSCWLGYRASRGAGELDRREGLRWAMHFGTLLFGMFVAGIGAALGAFSGFQMGGIALLLCGVVFLLAGVHLARPLAWVGALLLGGLPLVLTVDRWQWTVVGVIVAASMVAVAATAWRRASDDAR